MDILGLLRSKLRRKLLVYFFTNPEASHHLRELASVISEDPGNLSKELKRLCSDGLFVSDIRGRQKYFSINRENPLYEEIKSIISKTVGVEASLRDLVADDPNVLLAFIYGSYVSEQFSTRSDIDLMLITKDKGFNDKKILRQVHNLMSASGREIDFSYFSKKEWRAKLRQEDSFILEVVKTPKLIIKGDERELRGLA